jgi:hypothetical protein
LQRLDLQEKPIELILSGFSFLNSELYCQQRGSSRSELISTHIPLVRPPLGVRLRVRLLTDLERDRDPTSPTYDRDVETFWVAPFFMGVVNRRIVRRSWGLFEQWQKFYGTDFSSRNT